MSIAEGLRRRGIDVTTAAEKELIGVSDTGQLVFATQSSRVLVSQDADFLRLHQSGVVHAGIAYCRQGSLSIGEMLRRLVLIHDFMTAEEMRTRVEYL